MPWSVSFHLEVKYVPSHDLLELVQSNPFVDSDAFRFTWEVTFLDDRARPFPSTIQTRSGLEVVAQRSHELLTARVRDMKAPHALPIVERLTGARATTRAWSTVQRLADAG